MRSIYSRILLASLVTTAVSLAVFFSVSVGAMRRTTEPLFAAAYSLQLEEAINVYQSGGGAPLSAFIARLDRAFGAEHHLLDRAGRDILSGQDLTPMLTGDFLPSDPVQLIDGRLIVMRASRDGRFRLLMHMPAPLLNWLSAPYYVIVGAVCLLSWLVAVGIASPLRRLTAAVDRFGQGDLSAHIDNPKRDEIGRLGTSFNVMAGRIRTLLTAERRLLQDISHELRSPLTRLHFAAELARTAPDRNGAIDRVQKEIDRLSSLVGQLLEVTRAEGDPRSRRTEPVEIGRLVREVVDGCALEAQARGCTVSLDGSATRQIRGDRELLRRAIENVLRNAIRFAPRETAVDVTVRDDAAHTAIDIRDRGPGVPADVLQKVFEPFFRVDPSRDAHTGGLGLGLAIAYRAIHLHHGSIAATNERPGLRVTLALPHVEAGQHPRLN